MSFFGKLLKEHILIGSEIYTYLHGHEKEYLDHIKGKVRGMALSFIDTPKKREKVAKEITGGMAVLIPKQYKVFWPAIEPIFKKMVLHMLEKAAEHMQKEAAKNG